jgi:hypothetical protein
MRVRAEFAPDPPRIVAIAAEQPHVAFEPTAATGGESCRDPRARLEALAGTILDSGGASRLGAVLGGHLGCSHVLTLAQLVLATARTGLALEGERHVGVERPAGQRVFHRSLSVDGIVGRDGLHLVLQLADIHFAPVAVDYTGDPLARLASRLEIRAQAEIDLDAMVLRSLRAAERATSREVILGPWRDRSDRLADLPGRSALGGMAAALFDRLAGDPSDRPLLDALLHLAPTLIQCVPAMMEHWQSRPGAARPGMMAGGGMTDSCYMWRRGGALHQRMNAELAAIRSVEAMD